jgi:hypothetical protein
MIIVTVEHLPGRDASRTTMIGRATISNDETGGEELGNYSCSFWHRRTAGMGLEAHGQVIQFPRLEKGVWELVKRALIEASKGDEEIQFDGTRPPR